MNFAKWGDTMVLTAAEIETDTGKYPILVENEGIFIAKNDKYAAKPKPSGVGPNKVEIVKSLFGIIPNDERPLMELREERLARY